MLQQSGADETEKPQQQLYELVLANLEETKRLKAEMQKQAAAAATDEAAFQVSCAPICRLSHVVLGLA